LDFTTEVFPLTPVLVAREELLDDDEWMEPSMDGWILGEDNKKNSQL